MSACAGCGALAVRRTSFCLDCGADAAPGSRRLEVTGLAAGDQGRIAALLAALSGRSTEQLAPALGQGRFEVDVEGTPAEVDALEGALGAVGATIRQAPQSAAAPPVRLRLRPVGLKLATAVAAGVAGLMLGAPMVPWVALAALPVFTLRAVQLVSLRILVSREAAGRSLGALPVELLREGHLLQRGLTDRGAIGALRRCLDPAAEIGASLRQKGRHLEDAERRRVDAQLHQVVQQVLRLVMSVQRLQANQQTVRADILAKLSEVERTLETLTPEAARLDQGGDAPARALVAVKRGLTELLTRA